MNKFFGHLKTICIHRFWVCHYCFKAGIPLQGLTHDLSKFSPTEFFESVKYYSGTHSPIDDCKAANGYSMAWMHHKGRNKHHYEYWKDNFDKGGESICMPYKYAVEMLCDYVGAGRAYNKKNFSWLKELKWWLSVCDRRSMHPAIRFFIHNCLEECYVNQKFISRQKMKHFYERGIEIFGKENY